MKTLITSILALLYMSISQTYAQCNIEEFAEIKGIECGKLTVPENHDDPDGNSIEIAYVILKSEVENAYPVIYLSGGPGGALLSSGAINFFSTNPLKNSRDLILLDQRGIGLSSGLRNLDRELYDIMAQNLTDEKEQQLMDQLLNEYGQQSEQEGTDLQYYNTFQNAHDVGALMKHLNYDKYNLLGGSYGTRLARVVQDLFPAMLNAVVLNSPNPMGGDFLIDRLKSYDLALGRVFDYCSNDPKCNLENPNLKKDYLNAINALKESPIEMTINEEPFYVNAQDGIYFLRRILYANDSRTSVPKLIKEFQNGGGPLLENLIRNEFGPGYNFSMWLSVERSEQYRPSNTPEVVENLYNDLELLPAHLGLFTTAYFAMPKLHDKEFTADERTFKTSAVPTMITVNQYDPVTPPENGHIMMKQLTNGQLFILDEGGHGGGNTGCRIKVMDAFMNDPKAELDTSCYNLYKG